MIKIRYRGPNELSPGLHAEAECHGSSTVVYLLAGLSPAQRRAALRRLRFSARTGHCPRLPAVQLALALLADRFRTALGRAGAVFRLHPAGSTLPVMVISGAAIAFLLLSTVSIRVLHPRFAGDGPLAGPEPTVSAGLVPARDRVPGGVGQGNPGQGNPGQGNPGQGNPGQGNPGQGNPGQPGSGVGPSGQAGSRPGARSGRGSGGSGSGGSGSGGSGSGGSGSGSGGTTLDGSGTPYPQPQVTGTAPGASAPGASAPAPSATATASGSTPVPGSGSSGSGVCLDVGPLGICLDL